VSVKIFECLNESFKEEGLNLKPERLLLNVYNHGDSSWLHTDTDKPGYWTAILFMNEYWDINWGGDFVLVKDNEIYKSFAPTPGKFVVFRADILHGARPVSREAQFPRMALAMQCINNSKI
jgi:Rps23 Pro-64 3,4-dihydroxylase Tpa1-like proline 4-hydroxylase